MGEAGLWEVKDAGLPLAYFCIICLVEPVFEVIVSIC